MRREQIIKENALEHFWQGGAQYLFETMTKKQFIKFVGKRPFGLKVEQNPVGI